MADTQRDTASLLALLADNASGDISPQDLRDAIVSILGGYGGLAANGGGTQMTGLSSTPTLVDMWTSTLPSDGANVVASTSAETVTPALAGKYEVHCSVSFAGSASVGYLFGVYLAGSATALSTYVAVPSTGGNVTATASGIVDVGAGQSLDLRVSTSAPGSVLSGLRATLWIKRIS